MSYEWVLDSGNCWHKHCRHRKCGNFLIWARIVSVVNFNGRSWRPNRQSAWSTRAALAQIAWIYCIASWLLGVAIIVAGISTSSSSVGWRLRRVAFSVGSRLICDFFGPPCMIRVALVEFLVDCYIVANTIISQTRADWIRGTFDAGDVKRGQPCKLQASEISVQAAHRLTQLNLDTH